MENEADEFVTSDGNVIIFVDTQVKLYSVVRYESGVSAVYFKPDGNKDNESVTIPTEDVKAFCKYLRTR